MKKFKSENLDSKIAGNKTRMSNNIVLAFEKVVAHHENPAVYPLPALDVLTLNQDISIGDVFSRNIQIGEGFFGIATGQFDGKYLASVR